MTPDHNQFPYDPTYIRAGNDITFLALCVWRESRGESYLAQLGVAYSILNRVSRPSWWGSDVLSVVFKKWQYSSLTDPKDPQLTTWPLGSDPSWLSCCKAAFEALYQYSPNPVPGADSYHDTSISPPNWTETARKVAQIDSLVFYDVDLDYETHKNVPQTQNPREEPHDR